MAKDLRQRKQEIEKFEDVYYPGEDNSHIAACSNDDCKIVCGRKTIMNIQMWFGTWKPMTPISDTECYHWIPVYNTKDKELTQPEKVDKILVGTFGAEKKETKQEDLFTKKPKPKTNFGDYLD